MALATADILTIAAVIVIVLGVIFYNNLQAAQAARRATAASPRADPILRRFVHHEGAVVGQAIAVQGDRVLLRQGTVHKAVPLAQLERDGDDLRLLGTVDWMDAEKDGSAWAQRLAAVAVPTGPT